jgi:uncharacterized protein (TIGR02145 family)
MPLLGVAAIAGLSACGDENTTIMTTPQMMEAYEALPECTSDNEGRWVYVKDSAETYYCAENKWLAVSGREGKDGEDGASCTVVPLGDKSGYKIFCGGDSVGVLLNGVAGKNGLNGTNGTNGNDGENGVTPQLRINAVTNFWEVSYDNGTTWISTNVLATGPQGENGINGTNGNDGENGVTPQLRINTETNHWEVSYDNGATWSDMGVSASGPSEQSSSSVSSSSFTQSSSSTGEPTPCNTEAGNNCVYGTLIDSRDGQTYRTITIGSQTWMAQNLNYRYIQQTDGGTEADSSSYCLGDDGTGDRGAANCAAYGRLYLWSAAMDSVARFSETGKGCGYCPVSGDGSDCLETYKCNENGDTVRGACPAGWHLPSREEFETLIATVGGEDVAGLMLKAQYSWNDRSDGESGNGIDAYGFSALSVGYRSKLGPTGEDGFVFPSTSTCFWSTSEFTSSTAEFLWLTTSENARVHYIVGQKYHGYPVRCVKN